MLSNQKLDRTRRLALRLAGIELAECHRKLLDRRSRRLGIRNGTGLDAPLAEFDPDAADFIGANQALKQMPGN